MAQISRRTVLMAASAAALAGCGSHESASSQSPSPTTSPLRSRGTIHTDSLTYPMTITDAQKHKTSLKSKPARVAVISGTALNMWYDLGGTAVATTTITSNLRILPGHEQIYDKIPKIGMIYAPDVEALVSQKPDLVISQASVEGPISQRLREMGLPTIATSIRSHQDLLDHYTTMGAILQNPDKARKRCDEFTQARDAITAKTRGKKTSAVILYVTAKNLSVKLDNSIAGNMLHDMGVRNVASGLTPDNPGSETTQLDAEELITLQPEHVLVMSMVSSNKEAKTLMDKEFQTNPAWKGLKAVQDGKVSYLPQQYFLYHPGPFYPDALTYLASSLFPETFGEPKPLS